MTDERLAELERLASAATPGPWDSIRHKDRPEGGAILVYPKPLGPGLLNLVRLPVADELPGMPRFKQIADADFCAVARAALPELLAEVRRLRAAAAR